MFFKINYKLSCETIKEFIDTALKDKNKYKMIDQKTLQKNQKENIKKLNKILSFKVPNIKLPNEIREIIVNIRYEIFIEEMLENLKKYRLRSLRKMFKLPDRRYYYSFQIRICDITSILNNPYDEKYFNEFIKNNSIISFVFNKKYLLDLVQFVENLTNDSMKKEIIDENSIKNKIIYQEWMPCCFDRSAVYKKIYKNLRRFIRLLSDFSLQKLTVRNFDKFLHSNPLVDFLLNKNQTIYIAVNGCNYLKEFIMILFYLHLQKVQIKKFSDKLFYSNLLLHVLFDEDEDEYNKKDQNYFFVINNYFRTKNFIIRKNKVFNNNKIFLLYYIFLKINKHLLDYISNLDIQITHYDFMILKIKILEHFINDTSLPSY